MAEDLKTDFIHKAIKRFKEIEDDESELRDNFKTCLSFTYGEQWDAKVKQDREQAGRPALTFNRLPTFVQKVANEARQQKPQIKFNPRLDSDKEVAEIKEGIARQIQYHSEAGIATETAVEYSVAGSFGYLRLLTEYCDDKSFDMDIMVKPVYDPLTVFGVLVPTCFGRKPLDVFVVEDIPKAEFKTLYPDEEEPTEWGDGDATAHGWIGTETYRVGEYWYVEQTPKTIYQLKSGEVVEEKPDSGEIEDERTIQQSVVKFCKITAKGKIKGTETEWVTDEIPIYAVLAGSKIIGGKPKLFSLVQWQLDAQKMINFGKTRIAESLATSPISPIMVVEGQLENHEAEWQTANTTLRPYLQYKRVINGVDCGMPQRQTFEPPIAALSAFVQQEVDDLKATSGIFDQSLGAGTTDQSGIAIKSRQQQSDLTNAHFMDNLERTSQKMGRAIAKAIPKVYSTARVVKIVGPDEVQKMVQINQQHTDASGKPQTFDLSKGDDDVVVTMGRSFSSKRAESFDMMESVVQAAPGTLNIIGDLMFRNSDIAGADQLAERFKRMLPPQAQDPNEDQAQQAQQQLQQLSAQHQELMQHLQQATHIIETKQVEQQAKVQVAQMQEQSRQEIVKMQEATKLAVAQINASKDANQAFAELEIQKYNIMHDAAHDVAMQAHDQQHQQAMAQQQATQQAAQTAQQAGHQSDLSAQNAAQTSAQQEQAAEQAQGGE